MRLVDVGSHEGPKECGIADRRGEVAEFEQFYVDQYAHALRIVYALCGSWVVAEEVCQDAFLRAFRRWEELRGMERPDAWVRRVACNLATSRFRRVAAETRALARLASRRSTRPEETVSEASRDFWRLIRRLPRRQAQVVALYYADDLPVVEIAAVLEITEGSVKAHLHAARQRLATWYTQQEVQT